MRQAARIDDAGYFVEDFLIEGEELPAGTIEGRVPDGFYRPRWDGERWVEGESAAAALVRVKESKNRELTAAAYSAFDLIFPDGWRELAYAIAVNDQTRIKQGKDVMQQLKDLRAQVTLAKTVAEVQAVKWS